MRSLYVRAFPVIVALLLVAAFLAELGDQIIWGT